MRCAAACLVAVAAAVAGGAANAQPPAPTPADAASAAYPTPGAPPPGLQPPPQVGASEHSRYSIELIPQLGLAVPKCQRGETSSRNCDGVKAGGFAGFMALWRISPYFAWGGTLDLTALRYLPPDDLERSNAAAGSVYLGLVARLYFLQEGWVDPYLELGLGGGALATEFDETDVLTQEEARYDETGAGPAVQLGAGVDFYLGPHLRLGPAVAFTQVSVDKIRRCPSGGGGDCQDLPKHEDGYLNAYATVTARLTILLGDEL